MDIKKKHAIIKLLTTLTLWFVMGSVGVLPAYFLLKPHHSTIQLIVVVVAGGILAALFAFCCLSIFPRALFEKELPKEEKHDRY